METLGLKSRKFIGSAYTNLLIYNAIKNSTLSLFDERIFINNVEICYFKDDILLVFDAAEKDTEKNGTIDYNDDKILFIYSLNSNKLRKITDGKNSVKNYAFINNSKNMLITFTLSEHKNKDFSTYEKPTKIIRYDLVTKLCFFIISF